MTHIEHDFNNNEAVCLITQPVRNALTKNPLLVWVFRCYPKPPTRAVVIDPVRI